MSDATSATHDVSSRAASAARSYSRPAPPEPRTHTFVYEKPRDHPSPEELATFARTYREGIAKLGPAELVDAYRQKLTIALRNRYVDAMEDQCRSEIKARIMASPDKRLVARRDVWRVTEMGSLYCEPGRG